MHPDGGRRSFLDPAVLSRLGAVPLFSRRPMLGNVSGVHSSPHRGASVEFAEYRRYVPGDDPRRMDWRAYGRSDRFYVKEFEADTNLRCCLILDTSGSMDFGSGDVTKIEYARRLAGSLAYLAVQQGDAVGVSCIAESIVRTVPPRRTPSHLRGVFDILEQARPRGETQLVPRLHELAETIRQRALVVIISDLFVEPSTLRSAFDHLRFRKHDVAVFHLLDPLELEFRFQRPMRFLDMEGGPAIFAEPNEIFDRYQQALQDYLASVKTMTQDSAIDYQRVRIDENYEQVLLRFLIARTRARGGR
ncbi:DUF58 domain-containing protein [Planctomicrobium piriforme]|uniref:DUF58 domain-containing protein n=1 Tax=Planctomicrobium piriforme TaxID=1576369 RepID=A0A1I3R6U1_9PLAN|nr:DUF58 domain-containing protein [Planctomicrobium piriforme]SFJ41369.1 Protein of unknown function DUF58 [Planctomicrobium piriforme]